MVKDEVASGSRSLRKEVTPEGNCGGIRLRQGGHSVCKEDEGLSVRVARWMLGVEGDESVVG